MLRPQLTLPSLDVAEACSECCDSGAGSGIQEAADKEDSPVFEVWSFCGEESGALE